MITPGIPKAAAIAAKHCDELLSRAATPPDLDAEFARFARTFADLSMPALARLCDDRKVAAEVVETALVPVTDWFEQTGEAHRHSFVAIGQEKRGILFSVRVCELSALFDRILGGSGDIDEACTTLPASVRHFAEQFEDGMSESLCGASDRQGLKATASGDIVKEVAPFAATDQVWTATFRITPANGARPWSIRLAACSSSITELFGSRAASPATGRTIGARGIEGSAVAEVELPLRAVLVDVPMSIARLSGLAPGSIIPVAVNRNVPLMAGGLTIAHGSVGELDDRVALELTQTSFSE